ncbi:hypothetical protein PsorP6_017425 [Peronosclerospora sorghi]|uniref:Uncharacterized protein n=1 Tax=Peronosclerospora sorghi TaxID=230839 RepID=A0ACC0WKV3_9STRA|nr:hypothetical protein PsorP6_017425 [Peronosclerospora sorghi]
MPAQPRCAHQLPTPSSTDVGPSATVRSPSRRRGNRRHRGRGRSKGGTNGRHHPPRVTRHHREHRLDEALDNLHAVEKSTPSNRPDINKARRRVGRINASLDQICLRYRFDPDEKACVEAILSRTVHLSALVHGSLGAVASGNLAVYTEQLGVLKCDEKRLDKQLSAECIKSSRRMWNFHYGQHRVRQQGQGQVASQDHTHVQAQGSGPRQGIRRPSKNARDSRVVETVGTPSRQGRR